ncbi:MAG: helix-turn-helix domain-containing protein [Pseudomonadota bacterium]
MSDQETPMDVAVLLVPGFMLSAFALFTDALRLANWRSDQTLFHWSTCSPDGALVTANDGTVLAPTSTLEQAGQRDAVFIAAGFSPEQAFTPDVFAALRAADRRRAALGGWDTGPMVLAEAGLMDGQEMALHWQVMPAVEDRYRHVAVVHDRISKGGRRYTAPGGISTFDLAVELIRAHVGTAIADMVIQSANRYVTTSLLEPNNRDLSLGGRLRGAVALMEKNIADPISLPVLSDQLGISTRSLTRLFQDRYDQSPHQYYLALRLQYAASLLRQSNLSVLDIAVQSGFTSASRFSQVFRERFNQSPSEYRIQASWLRLDQEKTPPRALVETSDDRQKKSRK